MRRVNLRQCIFEESDTVHTNRVRFTSIPLKATWLKLHLRRNYTFINQRDSICIYLACPAEDNPTATSHLNKGKRKQKINNKITYLFNNQKYKKKFSSRRKKKKTFMANTNQYIVRSQISRRNQDLTSIDSSIGKKKKIKRERIENLVGCREWWESNWWWRWDTNPFFLAMN